MCTIVLVVVCNFILTYTCRQHVALMNVTVRGAGVALRNVTARLPPIVRFRRYRLPERAPSRRISREVDGVFCCVFVL